MEGYIVLSNGMTFEGTWHGDNPVSGEVVFYTGMTGYQEVISDPSYHGQIVVFAYPLIGNYGMNMDDFESSAPTVSGVITGEVYEKGHHYQANTTFAEKLKKHHIPFMSNVDTRTLIKVIRDEGDMKGMITNDLEALKNFQEDIGIQAKLVKEVATKDIQTYGEGNHHVVLMDFGYKKSIVQALLEKGCRVTVVPFDAKEEVIYGLKPDGILFSNGPGNPKELKPYMPLYKKLAENFPTMGICLGHQLMALAFGGNTRKMKFGHRGANHPVMNLKTNKVSLSSQNHGYVVEEETLAGTGFQVLYKNVNDSTVEGMVHTKYSIITTQFHPEAHPGPRDYEFIFTEFIERMGERKEAKSYA
ncbi:carbamoyl phosphate synthase small subunit [Fictibacillus sp. Mic-4]|uniref:carbamoyl phosphate synthase small subunit n=1 Tax=Fictibacillus sp. Mic-4 TaxID=3132826 RepID=UPI003CF203CB